MSAFGHVAHHRLMREMDAVEVADTHHGRAEAGGNFVEAAEDLHSWRRR